MLTHWLYYFLFSISSEQLIFLTVGCHFSWHLWNWAYCLRSVSPLTSQNHTIGWTNYTKLPVGVNGCVNMCVHMVRYNGLYSCLVLSILRFGSESTLTERKCLLMMNEWTNESPILKMSSTYCIFTWFACPPFPTAHLKKKNWTWNGKCTAITREIHTVFGNYLNSLA